MKLQSELVGADAMVKSTAECLKMRQMMIRAQAKYPIESVLCLPLYGWGDDYDTSESIKGGRAYCHSKSVAIAPPHGKNNSLDNTFIIALSRKNKSHEDMEAEYRKEILSLRDPQFDNWFYWKEVGRDVKVYVKLFVSLQDKPERCRSMFLTLGSGAFSLCWRRSFNYNAISEFMPSCMTGRNKTLHYKIWANVS
jgi:hypothetical protein